MTQWMGFALASFFLVYSIRQMSWSDFTSAIINVELKWVLLMALALLASMLLRSIRWQVIAALPLRATYKVWQASCVGYMGSAIYPAKAGEILKIVKLQQLTGLKHSQAIMSTLLDRVLDVIALLILLILINAQDHYFHLLSNTQIALLCCVIAFLLMGLYSLGFVWAASKTKFGNWLHSIYQHILEGVRLLKLQRLILPCLMLQFLITTLDILACWLLFCAFGWTDLYFMPAATMLVCLAAVFCLPSTPGYIGVYQVSAIFALAFFGINESRAAAYGTLFQVIAFILAVGVGVQNQLHQFIRQWYRK